MSLYTVLLWVIMIIFSVILSIIDIKTKKISNWMIISGCILLIILHCAFNIDGLIMQLASALLYLVFYFAVRIVSKKKLGLADVYFGLFQGLCLPWKALPLCVFIEVMAAFLLILIIKSLRYKKLPFIPFMAIGLMGTDLLVYFL